jgi:hypothetical protein
VFTKYLKALICNVDNLLGNIGPNLPGAISLPYSEFRIEKEEETTIYYNY